MKRKSGWMLMAMVLVVGLTVGCQSSGPCRSGWVGRPETGPWPDFSHSKHFLNMWLGGDLESLNRTLGSIAHSTACDFQNFPGALERFWYLIR